METELREVVFNNYVSSTPSKAEFGKALYAFLGQYCFFTGITKIDETYKSSGAIASIFSLTAEIVSANQHIECMDFIFYLVMTHKMFGNIEHGRFVCYRMNIEEFARKTPSRTRFLYPMEPALCPIEAYDLFREYIGELEPLSADSPKAAALARLREQAEQEIVSGRYALKDPYEAAQEGFTPLLLASEVPSQLHARIDVLRRSISPHVRAEYAIVDNSAHSHLMIQYECRFVLWSWVNY